MLKPTHTTTQVAAYLQNGYWYATGHTPHHFRTETITYNFDGLTAVGQRLAAIALQSWQDAADIGFVRVSGPAQITFDDNQSGAYTTNSYDGSATTEARVNVSTAWIETYGTQIGT